MPDCRGNKLPLKHKFRVAASSSSSSSWPEETHFYRLNSTGSFTCRKQTNPRRASRLLLLLLVPSFHYLCQLNWCRLLAVEIRMRFVVTSCNREAENQCKSIGTQQQQLKDILQLLVQIIIVDTSSRSSSSHLSQYNLRGKKARVRRLLTRIKSLSWLLVVPEIHGCTYVATSVSRHSRRCCFAQGGCCSSPQHQTTSEMSAPALQIEQSFLPTQTSRSCSHFPFLTNENLFFCSRYVWNNNNNTPWRIRLLIDLRVHTSQRKKILLSSA